MVVIMLLQFLPSSYLNLSMSSKANNVMFGYSKDTQVQLHMKLTCYNNIIIAWCICSACEYYTCLSLLSLWFENLGKNNILIQNNQILHYIRTKTVASLAHVCGTSRQLHKYDDADFQRGLMITTMLCCTKGFALQCFHLS